MITYSLSSYIMNKGQITVWTYTFFTHFRAHDGQFKLHKTVLQEFSAPSFVVVKKTRYGSGNGDVDVAFGPNLH